MIIRNDRRIYEKTIFSMALFLSFNFIFAVELMWRLSGRDLFIDYQVFTYIDQQTRNNFVSMQSERARRQNSEEEDRQRDAGSRVQFNID
jgi:hypothetical protein